MRTVLEEMSRLGQYVHLSHGKVRYQVAGPIDGIPVVLVHGLIGHLHVWDRNFDALVAHGFRVLRMDLYGRGFSERVKHPHNADLFVSQLHELMQEVGMTTPVSLVGSSMGGAVITRYASAYPGHVRSMLLVDSFGTPRRNDILSAITRSPILGEALIGTIGGPILRQAPHRGVYDRDSHRDFNRWFAAPLSSKGSKRALLSTLRHFMVEDHVPHFRRVNELDIPKLLIWGQHDRILPLDYGKSLHKLIPSAHFKLFEHSGHLPHFEESNLFNRLVLRFLVS